jgi:mannose-6-phosphate isomerase
MAPGDNLNGFIIYHLIISIPKETSFQECFFSKGELDMIIKTIPIYKDKIWGGSKLANMYHYPSSNECGEAWGISTHEEGQNIIANGPFKGQTVAQVFTKQKKLFGNYNGPFPLLIKVIDANDNLSIQVHPSNDYAKTHDVNPKTECWYILHAEEDSHLYIGHDIKTVDAFKQAIETDTILSHCQLVPVQTGDFFYIKSGTLHAINKGIVLLEVQQSSDMTYRIYDYNRTKDGVPRELHKEEAIAVTTIPDTTVYRSPLNEYFTFEICTNRAETTVTPHPHGDYIFILEGEGQMDNEVVSAGDFIIATADQPYQIAGKIRYAKSTIST